MTRTSEISSLVTRLNKAFPSMGAELRSGADGGSLLFVRKPKKRVDPSPFVANDERPAYKLPTSVRTKTYISPTAPHRHSERTIPKCPPSSKPIGVIMCTESAEGFPNFVVKPVAVKCDVRKLPNVTPGEAYIYIEEAYDSGARPSMIRKGLTRLIFNGKLAAKMVYDYLHYTLLDKLLAGVYRWMMNLNVLRNPVSLYQFLSNVRKSDMTGFIETVCNPNRTIAADVCPGCRRIAFESLRRDIRYDDRLHNFQKGSVRELVASIPRHQSLPDVHFAQTSRSSHAFDGVRGQSRADLLRARPRASGVLVNQKSLSQRHRDF